jgi:hypothetical protein
VEHGVAGTLAGLALLLFPGLTWVAALAPWIGWLRGLVLAIVVGMTLTPAALFALDLLFGVPIHLGTIAAGAAALGMMGIVAWARPRVLAALDA